MKKFILIFICLVSNLLFSQNWKSNFDDARKEALTSNKTILLVFSGSDWCAPCIKLDKNIWQSKDFIQFSDENYVLYKADFPKKKANQLTENLKQQNNALAEKYNQDGNYPFVVLLDGSGKVIGVTGYKNYTPLEYIAHLKSLEKK